MLIIIVWDRSDYLYKIDMTLNNLQILICHKTQTAKTSLSGWGKNRSGHFEIM